MITKQDIDRWYDEGQKTKVSKSDLKELASSWNEVVKNIQRVKFIQRVAYPIQWRTTSHEKIMEMITGKDWSPVNRVWKDLRTK